MIEWNLPLRTIGRRVLVHECVDSTNNVAIRYATELGNHGLAILAAEQTAGRGQQGRTWTAPPRSSVLLSIVLQPPMELRRPVVLTAWAAVAVCATVQELTGLPCHIKWPNDVFLRGQKVCGILIEQGQATIAGIGLNVQQSAEFFARAGLPQATSLAQHGAAVPTDEVAQRLLTHLDQDWSALIEGEFPLLESRWKWHLGVLGQRVRVECHEGERVGRLLELSFEGLLLEEEPGVVEGIPCERVRHLHRVEE